MGRNATLEGLYLHYAFAHKTMNLAFKEMIPLILRLRCGYGFRSQKPYLR